MILVEILSVFDNIIRYKNPNDKCWNYLEMDIETLNLLINNFGIISTRYIPNHNPTQKICADNPATGKEITLKYNGAHIRLNCGSNVYFYLPDIE